MEPEATPSSDGKATRQSCRKPTLGEEGVQSPPYRPRCRILGRAFAQGLGGATPLLFRPPQRTLPGPLPGPWPQRQALERRTTDGRAETKLEWNRRNRSNERPQVRDCDVVGEGRIVAHRPPEHVRPLQSAARRDRTDDGRERSGGGLFHSPCSYGAHPCQWCAASHRSVLVFVGIA